MVSEELILPHIYEPNEYSLYAASEEINDVAVAVTNTVILEAILGIAIVAVVLTLLELISIIYIVFPQIKDKITTMLNSSKYSSDSMQPFKPLIETLATRETGFTERANNYIKMIAWGFAVLLTLFCILLMIYINNQYGLQHKTGQPKQGAPKGTFYKILFWSMVTIIGIGRFQGFGCIALGADSSFCSTDSFAVVSTEWRQNNNFSHLALSTGICDGVADTGSFPDQGQQNFDTILAEYITKIFATQASDPNTATSDETYQMLSRASQRLRSSTGVQGST